MSLLPLTPISPEARGASLRPVVWFFCTSPPFDPVVRLDRGSMEASMSNTNVIVAPPKQKSARQTPIGAILHHIGPIVGLAAGLITTVAWICLLAYGLIKLL